jgi:hypothetical protein
MMLFLIFLCGIPIGLLAKFVSLFCNSEDNVKSHPAVKALLDEGWQIGEKPPYK